MFAWLFGLSDSEKKKFKKNQEKALRKAKHGIQINEENKELLREHRDPGAILTAPERKPGVVFEANFRPGVELGDCVRAEGDSSPGNNRPAGCGLVTAANGVGAAALASVKCSPRVCDDGRKDKNMPFNAMTQVARGCEFDIPSTTRVATAPKMPDPSPPEPPRKDDTRIPIEPLLDDLKNGKSKHRSKGWRREEKTMHEGALHPSLPIKCTLPSAFMPSTIAGGWPKETWTLLIEHHARNEWSCLVLSIACWTRERKHNGSQNARAMC
jgi:hypothetical protein